jgi:hypothetical protein
VLLLELLFAGLACTLRCVLLLVVTVLPVLLGLLVLVVLRLTVLLFGVVVTFFLVTVLSSLDRTLLFSVFLEGL